MSVGLWRSVNFLSIVVHLLSRAGLAEGDSKIQNLHHVHNLPEDVIASILFQCRDDQALGRASQVCRRWNRIIHSKYVFEDVELKNLALYFRVHRYIEDLSNLTFLEEPLSTELHFRKLNDTLYSLLLSEKKENREKIVKRLRPFYKPVHTSVVSHCLLNYQSGCTSVIKSLLVNPLLEWSDLENLLDYSLVNPGVITKEKALRIAARSAIFTFEDQEKNREKFLEHIYSMARPVEVAIPLKEFIDFQPYDEGLALRFLTSTVNEIKNDKDTPFLFVLWALISKDETSTQEWFDRFYPLLLELKDEEAVAYLTLSLFSNHHKNSELQEKLFALVPTWPNTDSQVHFYRTILSSKTKKCKRCDGPCPFDKRGRPISQLSNLYEWQVRAFNRVKEWKGENNEKDSRKVLKASNFNDSNNSIHVLDQFKTENEFLEFYKNLRSTQSKFKDGVRDSNEEYLLQRSKLNSYYLLLRSKWMTSETLLEIVKEVASISSTTSEVYDKKIKILLEAASSIHASEAALDQIILRRKDYFDSDYRVEQILIIEAALKHSQLTESAYNSALAKLLDILNHHSTLRNIGIKLLPSALKAFKNALEHPLASQHLNQKKAHKILESIDLTDPHPGLKRHSYDHIRELHRNLREKLRALVPLPL